jgi:hypothetical protein
MDMRLDEARRDEPTGDVDRLARRLARRTDAANAPAGDRQVDRLGSIGQPAAAKQKVEHDRTVCRNLDGGKAGRRPFLTRLFVDGRPYP